MSIPIDLPPLATPVEVAAFLRVSKRFVQDECKHGRMRALVIAGHYRITPDAVADYLERQAVVQQSSPPVSSVPSQRRRAADQHQADGGEAVARAVAIATRLRQSGR